MVAMYRETPELMSPEREYIIPLDVGPETLGQALRRLRWLERGLTQAQLAAQLEPSLAQDVQAMKNLQTNLSRYENDEVKRPDPSFLAKLERFYGLEEDTLGLISLRTSRQRRNRAGVPPNSIAIPNEPQIVKTLRDWYALTEDERDAIGSFTRYLRETEGGESIQERIEGFARYLGERERDA